MLLIYVRHGDPIYNPDSLTPLGERQAEAVGKRVAMFGVDKVYASSSERAKLTAKPACEMMKKEMEILDWCNEVYAWDELTYVIPEGRRCWLYEHIVFDGLMATEEMAKLRFEWYNHPLLKEYNYKKGIDRIKNETVNFMANLGYEFDEERGSYKHTRVVYDKVALFAHHGFGLAFLSCLLNIPYPEFCTHFDMCHTGMTVIDFSDVNGYSIPRVLTLSNDSHIYKEGLPTKYNNSICF